MLKVMMVLVLSLSLSTTAFAAEGDKNVSKITIELDGYTSNRVEEPRVSIRSDGCYAEGDIRWEEDFKYLRSGETAHGVVTLRTNYGYRFDISTTVKLNSNNLSAVIEVIGENEARLKVTYKTQKRLASVRFKDYDKGDRYIEWNRVSNADEYELAFFRDYDDEYYDTFTTSKTKFNLNEVKKTLSKEDKTEELYCEIRAKSDESYLMDSDITRSPRLTLKFSNSSSNRYDDDDDDYYRPTPSGNYSWTQRRDGSWYYTNRYGENATGWRKINGWWYYLDPNNNGRMCTGWIRLNNVWYYLVGSGEMVSNGWQYIGDKWYYFYSDGAMAYNTWIGSYYVGNSGAWIY